MPNYVADSDETFRTDYAPPPPPPPFPTNKQKIRRKQKEKKKGRALSLSRLKSIHSHFREKLKSTRTPSCKPLHTETCTHSAPTGLRLLGCWWYACCQGYSELQFDFVRICDGILVGRQGDVGCVYCLTFEFLIRFWSLVVCKATAFTASLGKMQMQVLKQ